MTCFRSTKGFLVSFSIFVLALLLATVRSGDLQPTAPPGPTMKTLDQIPPTWSQILPAAQRFQLVMGGVAVLDKETGLVWERSPSSTTFNWANVSLETNAVYHCNALTLGNRMGWRVPTIQELTSLIDPSVSASVKLPSGHPFTNLSSFYWSSTIPSWGNFGPPWEGTMWIARLDGTVSYQPYLAGSYVWCVRGGSGLDAR